MLLLSKMSFEECRKFGNTRENCISLPRWKKKKKRIEVQLICSFSFSLIQYHQIKSSKSNSKSGWEKKETKKMNIINKHWTNRKPIHLTSVWREYEQTTLTQLPAFTALYKCNEHTITSNAHSYSSHHFNADRDLSHWCFRRFKPIQQSNEWVWRAWQEKYPTRWEMTIHYTANDYSLFNTKQ